MEASTQVGGSRFTSKEISRDVGGSRFTSMEVRRFRGSFHCRWKWKLPLLPSIATSTNIFRGSFHAHPYTPTYLHLLARVSQISSCFHDTNPTLELPPWKLFLGSTCKYIEVVFASMKMELLGCKLVYFRPPWM